MNAEWRPHKIRKMAQQKDTRKRRKGAQLNTGGGKRTDSGCTFRDGSGLRSKPEHNMDETERRPMTDGRSHC